MSDQAAPSCKVCSRKDTTLSKCSKCKTTFYCSRACQTKDWPSHKGHCGKDWYDNEKIRRCDDGSFHEGKLELVTWHTPADPDEAFSVATGWGAVIEAEAKQLKTKFEEELCGDEKKLYHEWPQAFRWTCCGMAADANWGCDHHGRGSKPCTCDYCQMGEPLTEKIYNKQCKSAHGRGVDLPRGPDPRSFDSHSMATNATMRRLLGMEE